MTSLERRADPRAAYLDVRFTPDERRARVWRAITDYLSCWWNADSAVLDVGAGYCSFINAVRARRRVACDVHGRLGDFAAPGVECVENDATDMHDLDGESFDVVFASNLLEHLSRENIWLALAEFHRVLRPGGRLILIQPNYRLRPRQYFDDYTHVTPLSDRSLADWLRAASFDPAVVRPRFLPLTLRSRAGALAFLTPLYLRSPWRPLAGQMLVVSRRV